MRIAEPKTNKDDPVACFPSPAPTAALYGPAPKNLHVRISPPLLKERPGTMQCNDAVWWIIRREALFSEQQSVEFWREH